VASQGFRPGAGTAVVTGAASGIGRAVAARPQRARAPSGARLDHDGDAVLHAAATLAPRPAWALAVDVADEGALEAAVTRIEAEHGPIALWCSNAGIHRGAGLGDAEDWRRSLDVNLLGHMHAARIVLPRMARRGEGHFVITASAAGLLMDLRCAPYSVSKHAAVALAEWLAVAHAEDGVQVSCLCPEGVRTAMTRADSTASGAGDFLEPSDIAEALMEGLRDGRFLILTHPRTAEYEVRRAGDRERWIAGMARARQRLVQPAPTLQDAG